MNVSMRAAWAAWVLVLVLGCGRTEPLHPALVASITPLEQTVNQAETAAWKGTAMGSGRPPFMFFWRVLAQPASSRAALNAVGPDAQLRPDQPGDWVIELQVASEGELSAPVVALLHVRPAVAQNHAPVANAGAGQTVELGQVVTLDGSRSSDLDGDPLTFAWNTVTAPARVSLPGNATPSFTPSRAGRYEFLLRVSDPSRASDTASVSIVVLLPEVDAGIDAGFDAGIDAGVDAGHPVSEMLDAGDIYLVGTLMEGACFRDAFANLFTPNVASVGFDCSLDEETAVVRPTDGRLLYRNATEDFVREYHCDECTWRGVYPANVLANDAMIPTPCPNGDRLADFLLSADGELLHRCTASPQVWRNSTGSAVHTDPVNSRLRALGGQGWAFSATQISNWQTGVTHSIVGLPMVFGVDAVRWDPPDAFNVAVSIGPAITDELWRVTTDGAAQRIGFYGVMPPNTIITRGGKLDRAGRFFHPARNVTQNFIDLVAMREVGVPTIFVYSEATNPLVRIQDNGLVTGP